MQVNISPSYDNAVVVVMAWVGFISVLLTVLLRGNVSAGPAAEAQSLSEIGHKRLTDTLASYKAPYNYRSGDATRTHSCGHVRGVPANLRYSWVMKPRGLSDFYQKYTEAYGIPVLGSANVSDAAMKRACYVLRFMLAGHYVTRQSYYKLFGRVTVIGTSEKVTTVPEYKFLPDIWNNRTRGLGATDDVPVSSGAEENLLCFGEGKDRYHEEDIFLHELTHGLHLLGSKHAIAGFQDALLDSFANASRNGLWKNTYSTQNIVEYLAEGTQSYFHVNGLSDPPDGIHGTVDSPEKLRAYDPSLYELIQFMFPCDNSFLKRCNSTRDDEAKQELIMDCDLTREYQIKISALAAQHGMPCEDKNVYCTEWALQGECTANPGYMQVNCRKSCLWCNMKQKDVNNTTSTVNKNCTDENISCLSWAELGECNKNSGYMKSHCKHSCGVC
ncbi:hypothetical protein Btru_038229 [Bulinus truncatus]|nr:hypothetical protein Btru_038229 [Bulinus truncatus]